MQAILNARRALDERLWKPRRVVVRGQIGLQALDVLTPLGRGQALLVTGDQHSGKSAAVLDAILGQHGSGVRCIYAAVGQRYPSFLVPAPLGRHHPAWTRGRGAFAPPLQDSWKIAASMP